MSTAIIQKCQKREFVKDSDHESDDSMADETIGVPTNFVRVKRTRTLVHEAKHKAVTLNMQRAIYRWMLRHMDFCVRNRNNIGFNTVYERFSIKSSNANKRQLRNQFAMLKKHKDKLPEDLYSKEDGDNIDGYESSDGDESIVDEEEGAVEEDAIDEIAVEGDIAVEEKQTVEEERTVEEEQTVAEEEHAIGEEEEGEVVEEMEVLEEMEIEYFESIEDVTFITPASDLTLMSENEMTVPNPLPENIFESPPPEIDFTAQMTLNSDDPKYIRYNQNLRVMIHIMTKKPPNKITRSSSIDNLEPFVPLHKRRLSTPPKTSARQLWDEIPEFLKRKKATPFSKSFFLEANNECHNLSTINEFIKSGIDFVHYDMNGYLKTSTDVGINQILFMFRATPIHAYTDTTPIDHCIIVRTQTDVEAVNNFSKEDYVLYLLLCDPPIITEGNINIHSLFNSRSAKDRNVT